ncbi:MAG TPA: GNAT family N-acetyltransferase [Actinospica sp.]|jgi:hypothetical protein|nr:GNAT family N-acetyltransferase [Actinospica sp.]
MDILTAADPRFATLRERLWDRDPMQYPRYSSAEMDIARLYAADSTFDDRSALVLLGGEPVVGLLLTVETNAEGHVALSAYGRPTHLLTDAARDADELAQACRLLTRHYADVSAESGAKSFQHRDFLADGRVSPFTEWLMRSGGGRPVPQFAQMLDLTQPAEALLERAGKSNRRHYRKAADAVTMEVIEGDAATDAHIDAFRETHVAFRGKEVRSKQAWYAILDAVRRDQGFFVFAYAGSTLAVCEYFTGTGRTCYSSIGALVPGVAERYWGHATVWRGVFHAQQRGCVHFDVGERLYDGMDPQPSEKYLAISDFKAGFGGTVLARLDVVGGSM